MANFKKITCIECPQGCQLEIEIEGGRVIKVAGHKCPKGEAYGRKEVENPARTLTSTVVTRGINLKMVPVRTSAPIPKTKLFEAMQAAREIKLDRPVKAGDIIIKNLLNLGVDLIATRESRICTD